MHLCEGDRYVRNCLSDGHGPQFPPTRKKVGAGGAFPFGCADGSGRDREIGIADSQRRTVVGILNTVLADEFVLYVKSRRFHWNVEGSDFSELHSLFQSHYEQLGQIIDDVAERARALDGIAAGSLEEYLTLTGLKEEAAKVYDARGMITALLADHESLVRALRHDLSVYSDGR